jgi:hypothetical protein
MSEKIKKKFDKKGGYVAEFPSQCAQVAEWYGMVKEGTVKVERVCRSAIRSS